jgi:hypothetical protein
MRYGISDCAVRAAAHVRALTGADVLREVPPYSTEAEAAALIEAVGGLAAWADSLLLPLGWRRGGGEVALLGRGAAQVLAVRDKRWWRAPGRRGGDLLVRADSTRALASWGPA